MEKPLSTLLLSGKAAIALGRREPKEGRLRQASELLRCSLNCIFVCKYISRDTKLQSLRSYVDADSKIIKQ